MPPGYERADVCAAHTCTHVTQHRKKHKNNLYTNTLMTPSETLYFYTFGVDISTSQFQQQTVVKGSLEDTGKECIRMNDGPLRWSLEIRHKWQVHTLRTHT